MFCILHISNGPPSAYRGIYVTHTPQYVIVVNLTIRLCIWSGGMISYFKGLLGSREMRILILGLDGAGKTTILYRLQVGEVVTTIPTIGFNVEQVTYKNLKFQVWDLGGQTSIRPYWRCYYSNTDAIIYVVDSVDRDRIGISKDELLYMLRVSFCTDLFILYWHTFCEWNFVLIVLLATQ